VFEVTSSETLILDPLASVRPLPHTDFTAKSELDVQERLMSFILIPLKLFEIAFKRAIDFRTGSPYLLLKPDLCLVEKVVISGTPEPIPKLIVEVKTPWAFEPTDIAEAFIAQEKLIDEDPNLKGGESQSEKTKVFRAVSQLWGYMSVNHLRYGVITTYNETYFFRRLPSRDSTTSVLEVSEPIMCSGGSVPFFRAWAYFLDLLQSDFVYPSPFNSPILKRSLNWTSTISYRPQEISISDIFFNSTYEFRGTPSVVTGELPLPEKHPFYANRKNVMMKIWDGAKEENAYDKFCSEVLAYERLQPIQGKCVPSFCGCYVASSFIYILALENCGEEMEEETFSHYKEDVKKCLKEVHDHGIIHNDVALRNMVVKGSTVKLIDFGESKYLKKEGEHLEVNEKRLLNKEEFDKLSEEEMSLTVCL
jgi:hypothetical protein